MRRFVLAAVMFGAVSSARAADLPDFPALRGGFTDGLSTASVNWQGFYAGGQGGYGSSDANLSGTNQAMTAAILANTTIEAQMGVSQWPLILSKSTARASAFGAFGGYNSQWDDIVLGLEASYMHGAFGASSSASMRRFTVNRLSDGFYHDVTSTSNSSISISDMATFRGRAAYAYGSFLPYAFAGFALGNATFTRSVSVVDEFANFPGPFSLGCPATVSCITRSQTDALHNHLIYGYSAGLGVDINLIGGLFMRAEYEYVRFTSQVETSINTVRAGLGYKF